MKASAFDSRFQSAIKIFEATVPEMKRYADIRLRQAVLKTSIKKDEYGRPEFRLVLNLEKEFSFGRAITYSTYFDRGDPSKFTAFLMEQVRILVAHMEQNLISWALARITKK